MGNLKMVETNDLPAGVLIRVDGVLYVGAYEKEEQKGA